MKSLALLLALPLLSSCGVRALAYSEYETLQDCVIECVDATWGDVKDINISGGHSGGGSNRAKARKWSYMLPLSEVEMANRVFNLRDLLMTKLEEAGARIHGRGATGNPDDLKGFDLDYTSAGEEGMVWARRVNHGNEYNSIFIVFHGVNTN
jgi:hypothetical protein